MKHIISIIFLLFSISYAFGQEQLNLELVGHFPYSDIESDAKLNDIWGYVDEQGDEYALVGLRPGVSIVALDRGDSLEEIIRIPGPYSTWRDLKTYGNYAFVVHDAISFGSSQGLLVIDLSDIENNNITYEEFFLPGYTRAHNIYIDENGIAYLTGSNVKKGGALMLDVTNPDSITFVGNYDDYYLHDCVTRGDTMWGGAIYLGALVAVDVSDKMNPRELGFAYTPNLFTHNCWFSKDGKTIFTTDEKTDSYIASYDVSDIENIKSLDKIQSFFSDLTIPHNTHVYNEFLVNSYYRDGLQIVDAQYPDNLIDVGHYDTSPLEGDGFNGAWGAYPFLPSKRILVSDMEGGLMVFKPNYTRASYLHINVISDETGLPLPGTKIVLNGVEEIVQIDGTLKTGQAVPGNYDVVCSLEDYATQTKQVKLETGKIEEITIRMTEYIASIDEINLNTIFFGPNPVSDEFYLWSDVPVYGIYDITFYDLTGRVVQQYKINQLQKEKNILNVSNLGTGHYIVEMYERKSQKSIRQKIVKK